MRGLQRCWVHRAAVLQPITQPRAQQSTPEEASCLLHLQRGPSGKGQLQVAPRSPHCARTTVSPLDTCTQPHPDTQPHPNTEGSRQRSPLLPCCQDTSTGLPPSAPWQNTSSVRVPLAQSKEGANHFLPRDHFSEQKLQCSHPGGQEVKYPAVPPVPPLLWHNSTTTEGQRSMLRSLNTTAGKLWGSEGFSRLSSSPTPRPGLTSVGAQAHSKDQHPATPFALHAVPKIVLSGWFLSCAAPRLRNLGWAGRSSENPHLRMAITTPLSLCLDYKIITILQTEGGTRARQVLPGSQNQPRTSPPPSLCQAAKGGHSTENCPRAMWYSNFLCSSPNRASSLTKKVSSGDTTD